MWDEPSAEVTQLKKVCETMLEEAEEDIESWYYHHQDEDIQDYLCRKRFLKNSDSSCLDEIWTGSEKVHVEEQTLIENVKDEF